MTNTTPRRKQSPPDKAKRNEIARRAGIYQRHVAECASGCSYDAARELVKHCMVGEIMHVRHFAAIWESRP